MLYAILAYHVEAEVLSWTPEADAALMTELHQVHDQLQQARQLGPAARLTETGKAKTLRGPGSGTVIDGPFAETKEQLLGFYVVDFDHLEEALGYVRELGQANPGGAYEIRPLRLFMPGADVSDRELAAAQAG